LHHGSILEHAIAEWGRHFFNAFLLLINAAESQMAAVNLKRQLSLFSLPNKCVFQFGMPTRQPTVRDKIKDISQVINMPCSRVFFVFLLLYNHRGDDPEATICNAYPNVHMMPYCYPFQMREKFAPRNNF